MADEAPDEAPVFDCEECKDTSGVPCILCDATGECEHCGQICPTCDGVGVEDCPACR